MNGIEITPTELKSSFDKGNFPLVLDVREAWEYNTAHLDPSTLIPLGQLHSQLDKLDKNAEIVTLCHHGVRSLNAAFFLRQNGFKNVRSLAGGIDLWSMTIDPKVPRY